MEVTEEEQDLIAAIRNIATVIPTVILTYSIMHRIYSTE